MKKQYGDLRQSSGVTHYDIGPDSITVHFGDKSYTYTHESAGKTHVEAMIRLAKTGAGLASHIARHKPRPAG